MDQHGGPIDMDIGSSTTYEPLKSEVVVDLRWLFQQSAFVILQACIPCGLLTYRRMFPKPTQPPIAAKMKEVREGHWSRPSSAVFVYELKTVLNKFLIAIVAVACNGCQTGHDHC